ncbi:DUF6037 family protein [Paenibacillus terrae]|uniref:Uncharacterized protein n=1 Tax=Paenibacillus terrae TaxID=159743 RepID=A0A0D7X1H4_9BACL|nr:DUF6037 family protein [Paenibacillus terrae]KJD43877.1 hypothetical protein QD47_20355 [Paenibacillus terrae]
MGYSYSGIVDGLKVFYSSMHQLNVEIGTFEHKYNNIISDAIFDTRDSSGWSLTFIKRVRGNVLCIPIQKGYRFAIIGDKEYNAFIEYFGIGSGKGQFSIKEFVDYLDKQIPAEYRLSDNKRKVILKYNKLDNDSDGIYPVGVKNWGVIHARNPELPEDKYHRTAKNLLKTKELYPDIYNAIKDIDITIIYGKHPGENTETIKAGKMDYRN